MKKGSQKILLLILVIISVLIVVPGWPFFAFKSDSPVVFGFVPGWMLICWIELVLFTILYSFLSWERE